MYIIICLHVCVGGRVGGGGARGAIGRGGYVFIFFINVQVDIILSEFSCHCFIETVKINIDTLVKFHIL